MLSWAHQRRRNGELLPSVISSFLRGLSQLKLDRRATIRLRSTPKLSTSFAGGARRFGGDGDGDFGQRRAPTWRPRPGEQVPSFVQDEDASQDTPSFVPGERVSHAKFGSGTISELNGSGKEAKVTIDFDDESVGRKRLVVAFAALQRGFD